jgi:hypothetical protein
MNRLPAAATPKLSRPVPACRRRGQQQGNRRGVSVLEALCVVPLLLLMTVATLQFGLQMVARQGVAAAAVAGVREAARGADVEDVTARVAAVLAAHRLGSSDQVSVHLETGNGDDDSQLPPGQVRVTVILEAQGRGGVAPDWLGDWGLSLGRRCWQASSLALME